MKLRKKLISLGLTADMALSLAACGGSAGSGETGSAGGNEKAAECSAGAAAPAIDSITLKTSADSDGDYGDVSASIKILTNRTDIVDTVYKRYAEQQEMFFITKKYGMRRAS